jgi:DNA polymerase-3 subunit gamma/tau
MPYLSRAWQMLLKGFEEVAKAPNPRVAAEMVLIRLAYTSDLPTPDELIRTLGGGAAPFRRPALAPGDGGPADQRVPLNSRAGAPVAKTDDEPSEGFEFDDGEPIGDDEDAPASPFPVSSAKSDPRSFADVVALASEKRDAMLKIHLEDNVSLVKFDAAAGSIDLFLLPGAPPELANDLREKLNLWTTRRWLVVLSKEAGAPAIGVVRRQREAAELELLKTHPAVRAVLEAFPDAKIAEVRRIAGRETDTDSESEAV